MSSFISVIMSVFDTNDDWLVQSIESILKQSYGNFEFIIINDGCCESNQKILEHYAAVDSRIVLIKNKQNIGLTKSLNVGLKAARGDLVARIDADDLAASERFEKQVAFFEKNESLVLCGTDVKCYGNEKKAYHEIMGSSNYLKSNLLWRNAFAHPSVMFRRSVVVQQNLYYNEDFPVAQDYELWCRISEYGDVTNVPEPLCFYRIHKSQISQMKMQQQMFFRNMVIKSNLKKAGLELLGKDYSVYLSIMGYDSKTYGIFTILNGLRKLVGTMLKKYGVVSICSIFHFLWNAFWMIKHRLCGNHLRFFSR